MGGQVVDVHCRRVAIDIAIVGEEVDGSQSQRRVLVETEAVVPRDRRIVDGVNRDDDRRFGHIGAVARLVGKFVTAEEVIRVEVVHQHPGSRHSEHRVFTGVIGVGGGDRRGVAGGRGNDGSIGTVCSRLGLRGQNETIIVEARATEIEPGRAVRAVADVEIDQRQAAQAGCPRRRHGEPDRDKSGRRVDVGDEERVRCERACPHGADVENRRIEIERLDPGGVVDQHRCRHASSGGTAQRGRDVDEWVE